MSRAAVFLECRLGFRVPLTQGNLTTPKRTTTLSHTQPPTFIHCCSTTTIAKSRRSNSTLLLFFLYFFFVVGRNRSLLYRSLQSFFYDQTKLIQPNRTEPIRTRPRPLSLSFPLKQRERKTLTLMNLAAKSHRPTNRASCSLFRSVWCVCFLVCLGNDIRGPLACVCVCVCKKNSHCALSWIVLCVC